jgi:SAM-dependent methyltransferase
MPAEKSETAATAGISPPEEVDVAALFARLKDEVRHAPGLDVSDGFNRGLVRTRLRSVAERWWPVTAERPVERRLMRFYVEPFAADQRAFNDAALKLLDELFEEIDLVFSHLDRVEHELAQRRQDARRVEELEERLTRVERRRDGSAPATVAAQPAAAALPDYFAFESRMRGRSDEIRERQRAYVEDFRDAAPVLDVGCGRGELVGLLGEAGVEARGVDADADMVAFAQGEGLAVEQADLLAHLEGLEDGSLGGVFAGQVVEHLPPPALVRLLELAAAKLRPGGVLVAETINPLSPLALRYYFSDLTHAQPLVPETLELLARQVGFRDTELRYLNPPEERLHAVELPEEAAFDRAREALAENVRRLNEVLFAPLDYALVARA